MNKTEEILRILKYVNWAAAPQSANREDLEGATAYLQMYAKFILENKTDMSQSMTPFASPFEVLGVQDVQVPQSIIDDCQRLAGQSPLAYDKVFVIRSLEWAALCDSGHPSTAGRESMFDPLIGLVVRRVSAMIRKGYWVVDEGMFPLLDWINRYGVPSAADGPRIDA